MTSDDFQARLATRAAAANVSLFPFSLVERLEAYYRLLAAWNRRINLTALDLDTLPAEAVDRLFIEPLAAARHAAKGKLMLDVGSGGGSPAIPFALATAAAGLTMVESRTRKSVFLREAARAVEVQARVVTARFEAVAETEEVAGGFDIVTIRAVRVENEDWPRLRTALRSGGAIFLLHQAGLETAEPEGLRTDGSQSLTEKAQLSVFARID